MLAGTLVHYLLMRGCLPRSISKAAFKQAAWRRASSGTESNLVEHARKQEMLPNKLA